MNQVFLRLRHFLRCFRPWEQIIQERKIGVFCMGGQLSQKIIEVFVHIQVVCLCSLNQAIDDCACLCAMGGIHVNPVLSTQSEGPYGLPGEVVMKRDMRI